MKLVRFLPPRGGQPLDGEVVDGWAVAFDDGSTVCSRLRDGVRRPASGKRFKLRDVRLLAPYRPGAIYGIGRNYAAHAAELQVDVPERPVVFMKPPSSVAPPRGVVRRPVSVTKLDYEVELAVVLGPYRSGVPMVAGYAVANDVSARDLQRNERMWTRAKGAPTFCPFGPWVTTADEVPDVGELRLRSWVNDDPRQDGRAADMVHDVPGLIAYLAEIVALEPGDLLLTGTPEGVGEGRPGGGAFLVPGDEVRVEIPELGELVHTVVDEAGDEEQLTNDGGWAGRLVHEQQGTP